MNSKLRIIVTGLIAQHPMLGGMTWHYLQYLIGLKKLGHDVYYFEDSGEWPYNFDGGPSGNDWIVRDPKNNLEHLSNVMSRFGLENKWAYRFPIEPRWYGLPDAERKMVINSADMLINVSGSLEQPQRYRDIPILVYIDTDPVVTQIKLENKEIDFCSRVNAHDIHFTFGECLNESSFGAGHNWLPTRQPIILSEWKPVETHNNSYTTIMNWTSYKPLVYKGRTYGQKDIQFKKFISLPSRLSSIKMTIAMSGTEHKEWVTEDVVDRKLNETNKKSKLEQESPSILLLRNGWNIVDSVDVCGDIDKYRHFIKTSKAEWSVAKDAYVSGQPGWFSERSACYLAAGRPVIVQDTGFSNVFPVGEGIVPFNTLEEAIEAIENVELNYERHSIVSRGIADDIFNSDIVLNKLIIQAMN